MSMRYGFDDAGGFYAIDDANSAYAYPTSTNARRARKNAEKTAREMIDNARKCVRAVPEHIRQEHYGRVAKIANAADCRATQSILIKDALRHHKNAISAMRKAK